MRTDKELLQVMLDNIGFLKSGLCRLALTLWLSRRMTFEERMRISDYLEGSLPRCRYALYCWPQGLKEPRIKWLKEQIEKLTIDEAIRILETGEQLRIEG